MSQFSVRRSRKALIEIDAIWLYLARHDLSAAEKFLDRLDAVSDLLAAHPRIGRVREEMGGVRGYSIAPYILVYRVDEDRRVIDLLSVLDGRRNIAAALDL